MDPILETIDQALAARGLSDAAASRLAVGNPSLLKNMRMERQGEKRYNLPALMKLAEVLGLEFYFGPPRPSAPEADPDAFALIPLHEAELSAGAGAEGSDAVEGMVAFRRDWLARLGVIERNARLARIRGDSMEPLLRHGDVVMIDIGRRDVPLRPPRGPSRRPHRPDASLYAVRRGTDCLVKRVERSDWKGVVLLSENWAGNPPEFVPDTEFETGIAEVLGQVRWWAHSVVR